MVHTTPNKNNNAEDVNHHILGLRDVWFTGPDDISGYFLYELMFVIAYPLLIMFQPFLDEGTFHSMLKFSSVTPIFNHLICMHPGFSI